MPKGLNIQNHESLALVVGLDDETQAVLEAGAPDDAMWVGGALVVEPRYVQGVCESVRHELEERNGTEYEPVKQLLD